MASASGAEKWAVIAASVRGAAHLRANLPNQDAVKVMLSDGDLPAVLAVSDGHGSAKCFRSQEGSRIAVDVAIDQLQDFARSIQADELSPSAVQQTVKESLPKAMVRRWRECVAEHYEQHPLLADEISHLDEATKSSVKSFLHSDGPFLGYGATLVTALLTPAYFICLQLGDGELLAVSSKTGRPEQPLETDEYLIANETTSLCQENAWSKFRWRCQQLLGSPPPLVLLATDGYANSFATPDGFRQVAADLHSLLYRDGVEKISGSLPGWLEESSQQGSGDDATVAVLYCQGTGQPVEETSAVTSTTEVEMKGGFGEPSDESSRPEVPLT